MGISSSVVAGTFLILLMTICSASELNGGDGEAQPAFEVLVLGTYHAPAMFNNPDYTPAHIRATLLAASPDVVAVESHPTWFANGRFHVVTYEAQGVAVPFARERGLPVYGVDWKDIWNWDRREEFRALRIAFPLEQAIAAGEALAPRWFGRLNAGELQHRRAAAGAASKVSWEYINDVHGDEFGKLRYSGKSPDDDDFAQARDRGIAANCVEVMSRHRGQRLVVVVGAHHKPFLDILFSRMNNVRVLELGQDVKVPCAKELDRAWSSSDLVVALGHNLDTGSAYFHAELVDIPRVNELLSLLDIRGDRPDAVHYFRARLHMAQGNVEEAEKELDQLIASGAEGDVYPFPMREWRMRYSLAEAARLEKARLLLERKMRDEAKPILDRIGRALAFRLKMLEMTRPRELRRIQGIKDAGFELGARAADIFDGWSGYFATGHGIVRFNGDQEIKIEGQRSLCIVIDEPNPKGYGFLVRQEISLPPGAQTGEKLGFSLHLRGEGVTRATLEIAPPWSSRERTPIVSTTVELPLDTWIRAGVDFDPPRVPTRGKRDGSLPGLALDEPVVSLCGDRRLGRSKPAATDRPQGNEHQIWRMDAAEPSLPGPCRAGHGWCFSVSPQQDRRAHLV